METVNFLMDGAPLIEERVLVLGLGIVGQLTCALLSRFPWPELMAVDAVPAQRAQAAALTCARYRPRNWRSNRRWADLVYEVSGNPAALDAPSPTRPLRRPRGHRLVVRRRAGGPGRRLPPQPHPPHQQPGEHHRAGPHRPLGQKRRPGRSVVHAACRGRGRAVTHRLPLDDAPRPPARNWTGIGPHLADSPHPPRSRNARGPTEGSTMYTLAVRSDFVAQHFLIGDCRDGRRDGIHHYVLELQLGGHYAGPPHGYGGHRQRRGGAGRGGRPLQGTRPSTSCPGLPASIPASSTFPAIVCRQLADRVRADNLTAVAAHLGKRHRVDVVSHGAGDAARLTSRRPRHLRHA
ncbi:MAG: hypothetical protein R2838_14575 [Caldilineaceae bacterium]